MNQRNWETSMGMRGYRGSPAERDDRAAGIAVGRKVKWLASAPGEKLGYTIGTITRIEIDSDGDPVFHLTFEVDHKDVAVERDDIAPLDRGCRT